jgi:hydrogenase expression/formation protein HypE
LDCIKLAHGGGGSKMQNLINDIFVRNFGNEILNAMEDAAKLSGNLAFTTDSFTVKPIFFPGGDIGRLAVCGTVNDLSMRGAKPLYMSSAFIIEEGFPMEELDRIAASMAEALKEANIIIVTGDTKVVEKGSVDKIFINTAGIGIIADGIDISIKNAKPGDVVIISGNIGDHGMAVMMAREEFDFKGKILSDIAPLNNLVKDILALGGDIRVLRDPTRGGVSETLYEIANMSGVGVEIYEEKLPVAPGVKGMCDILGLDYLHLANEGKLIAVVKRESADKAVEMMKKNKYGENAAVIGEINDSGIVTIKTAYGTSRILDRPSGELLPRIC